MGREEKGEEEKIKEGEQKIKGRERGKLYLPYLSDNPFIVRHTFHDTAQSG